MEFISHLTSVDRERLITEGEVQRLSAGEYLLRRGQRGGDMYLVESGRLEVVDIRQSPEVVLDVLGVGRVVGEMAFVDGSARRCSRGYPRGRPQGVRRALGDVWRPPPP